MARSNLSPQERFWCKVERGAPDACWPWISSFNNKGYGQFYFEGRPHIAPRMAVIFSGRTIPPGLVVMHECDNPPCCNPAHLKVGTQSQNNKDAFARGRKMPQRSSINVGVANPSAKITADDVLEIRRLAASGIRHVDLARRFGVDNSQIGHIVHRRSWRHV